MTGRCQPLSAFIIKWQTFFCSRWISGATHGECSATLMDNWSHLQPGAKKSGMDHRDHQQNIPGWWFQPLWKIWKSIGIIIPNIWKNKKKKHQPGTARETRVVGLLCTEQMRWNSLHATDCSGFCDSSEAWGTAAQPDQSSSGFNCKVRCVAGLSMATKCSRTLHLNLLKAWVFSTPKRFLHLAPQQKHAEDRLILTLRRKSMERISSNFLPHHQV